MTYRTVPREARERVEKPGFFDHLSPTARVLITTYWGTLMTAQMHFDRPETIGKVMKAGLDELVEHGYLETEKLNRYKDSPVLFKPTDKLASTPAFERAAIRRDQKFMEEHGCFPVTEGG